jgi:hypothetical protein
MTEPEQQQI